MQGFTIFAGLARFEWALNIAATAREATPRPIEVLAAISPRRASSLALRLQPSVSYFASGWPIDAIWRANQQKEVPTVDLASRGTSIEIRRIGDAAAWHCLEPATFAFRTALADGLVLAVAAAAATVTDPAFDLATALERVCAEGLAIAFAR